MSRFGALRAKVAQLEAAVESSSSLGRCLFRGDAISADRVHPLTGAKALRELRQTLLQWLMMAVAIPGRIADLEQLPPVEQMLDVSVWPTAWSAGAVAYAQATSAKVRDLAHPGWCEESSVIEDDERS